MNLTSTHPSDTASALPLPGHPLEPLSPDELWAAAALIKADPRSPTAPASCSWSSPNRSRRW